MYPKSNFSPKELKFSFIKELAEKKKSLDEKEITSHSESSEISDIIAGRLLQSIKNQLTT